MKKRVGKRIKITAPHDVKAGQSIEVDGGRWRVTCSASEGAEISVSFVESSPVVKPAVKPKTEKQTDEIKENE